MKNIRKIVLLLVAIIFVGTVKIPAMAGNFVNVPMTSATLVTEPSSTQNAIFEISYTVPSHCEGDNLHGGGIWLLVTQVETNKSILDGVQGTYSDVLSSEQIAEMQNAEEGDVFTGTFEYDVFCLENEPSGTYIIEIYDNNGKVNSFQVTISVDSNITPSSPCGGSTEDKTAEDKNVAVVTVPKETPAEKFEREYKEKIDTEKNLSVESFASNGGVTAVADKANVTGKVYNISRLTTVEGYVSALNKIAKDSASSNSVAIYSDYPMFFNSEIMTTILDSNKTFVYTFKHEGHIYKVTIPAGAKLDLGENRAEGPLYIGSVLGTSVLVE